MGLIPVFPGKPSQKHQFLVRVDGIDGAWFENAKIPTVEIEIDEFNLAGSIRATKFAGRVTIDDCTLEKGIPADFIDTSAWDWLISAANTKIGELGDPELYKKDVEICQTDKAGVVVKTYLLKGAFCSKIELSNNEGGSSEHMVETMTLTVDDLEVI